MTGELKVAFVTLLIVGGSMLSCSSSNAPVDDNANYIPKTDIAIAVVSEDPLAYPTDDQAIKTVLQNGVRLTMYNSGAPTLLTGAATATPAPTTAPTGPISSTNVQVDGVDEGDPVKYDGRYLYVLRANYVHGNNGGAPWTTGAGFGLTIAPWFSAYESTLNIVRTDSAAATTVKVSETKLPGLYSQKPNMYRLSGAGDSTQSIATVGQKTWSTYFRTGAGESPSDLRPIRPNRVVVQLHDIAAQGVVNSGWKVELEGWLSTSRQVGDVIYVVGYYWPNLPWLNFAATTDADRRANERAISTASVSDLLPHKWDENGEDTLVGPRACLLPKGDLDKVGFRELVWVAAINIRERRIADVECLNAGDNGIYMSKESLYIGGTRPGVGGGERPKTIFHKLRLADGAMEYRATGAVDGELAWLNSSYYIDEHAGDLRVVSTSRRANGLYDNRLSVLRDNGSQRLEVLATLPSQARPTAIGKPGERIYAVRFAGLRAYIVTFREVDPLYVIDLSNPADPAIVGELEVPGFSRYLRPVTRDYLLGVGQEVDSSNRAVGVKFELFDVRDISHPVSVGAKTFEKAQSNALYDPHALTFVTTVGANPRYRIATSLDISETLPEDPRYNQWAYTGLHLFEISGLASGAPQFQFQGVLKAEERSPSANMYSNADPVRSVLHDDAVFYVYGDRTLSALWQDVH